MEEPTYAGIRVSQMRPLPNYAKGKVSLADHYGYSKIVNRADYFYSIGRYDLVDKELEWAHKYLKMCMK